jgi:hypothetical protein
MGRFCVDFVEILGFYNFMTFVDPLNNSWETLHCGGCSSSIEDRDLLKGPYLK